MTPPAGARPPGRRPPDGPRAPAHLGRPPRAPRAAAGLRWALLAAALGALLALWARAPHFFQPSRRGAGGAAVDGLGGPGR